MTVLGLGLYGASIGLEKLRQRRASASLDRREQADAERQARRGQADAGGSSIELPSWFPIRRASDQRDKDMSPAWVARPPARPASEAAGEGDQGGAAPRDPGGIAGTGSAASHRQ